MKTIKHIILITAILIFGGNLSHAGDFQPNTDMPYSYIDNPDPNTILPMDGLFTSPMYNQIDTTVVRTKNKSFFDRFKFGKKKSDSTVKPEVIDIDNAPVIEEATPKIVDTAKSSKKKKKKENNLATSNTAVDIFCDDMKYDEERKEIIGTGNAKVVFKENNSVMYADKIVYNHDMNYIEGIDNVKITRAGKVMDGDYTKLDLNYGNAMVDNPIIDDYMIKVVAKSGNITSDTLEAYDGVAYTNQDQEQRIFSSQHRRFFPMEVNDNTYRKFYPQEFKNKRSKYHIKTKELYVNSTDGHDVITFKNADIYFGKVLMMKGANLTLSTDKTQSFAETSLPEIGSMRYVGAYVGPGFLFNTPLSSTLKVVPMVTMYNGKFGVGIMGRLRHKRNITEAIYSTAANEFVLRGTQQFGDSNFFLEYAHMAYMNDWITGSDVSQYLMQLAYQKRYHYPDLGMSISHRATAGYLTDKNGNHGTARFRYQAMYAKNLLQYHNYDQKLFAALDVVAQGQMGVYGTGDSTGLFRVGPSVRTQYRGWGQNITYFQSGYGGTTPLRATDDYKYGHSTLHILESFRLNKYISLAYYGVINLSNDDDYKDSMFRESRFLISIGPDDAKISFGYDVNRQSTVINYTALIGSKNQDIAFKKFFMKDPSKLGKEKPKKERKWHIFNLEENKNEVEQTVESIESAQALNDGM